MDKKPGILLLIGLLVFSLAFFTTGCQAPATGPQPAKPEVIKITIHDPSTILTFKKGMEYFQKEVPVRTNGRVEVEIITGGPMGDWEEQPDNIQQGVFDMGMVSPTHTPGKIPLWSVALLPGITDSIYAHNMALVELAKHPSMIAELEERWNQKLLFPGSMDAFEMMTERPITSIDNLRGFPIRAIGSAAVMLNKLGAKVSAIPGPDVYTSIERGIVDGAVFPVDTFAERKIHELAPNLTLSGNLGFFFGLVTMNLDTWNALPADIQQIMLEVSQEAVTTNFEVYHEINMATKKTFEAAGVKVTRLPDNEIARLQELAKATWEDWIVEMENDGYVEARKIFDLWVELVRKHEANDPWAAKWWPERR
ncbi:MAG: TRAP transporter substrate-binding protein DctP [Syntrophomonadaceae bacterium]|nr:TRAP transporter substrate-binding protein DctP [Syntrophomonadaceae bacterium]